MADRRLNPPTPYIRPISTNFLLVLKVGFAGADGGERRATRSLHCREPVRRIWVSTEKAARGERTLRVPRTARLDGGCRCLWSSISARARRFVGSLPLTCFAVLAGTGAAFAACPAQPVATPFLQWSDANGYFLVPGGSFEGSSDDVGWRLDNASLTSGNESFQVNGSDDSQSLRIDGGGSATSPYFCVDNSMSSLRFFAQQLDGG